MTEETTFDRIHEFVARWEGGYVDHPSDPGGVTNHGVSLAYLKGQPLAYGDINGDGIIDRKDIRQLTKEQAKTLLRRDFWYSTKFSQVAGEGKPLMASVLYDTAMNMGTGYAKRMAQAALGVTVDGVWGKKTWAAIKAAHDKTIALRMCEERIKRYQQIAMSKPSSAVFLNGWLRRVDDLKKHIKMWGEW